MGRKLLRGRVATGAAAATALVASSLALPTTAGAATGTAVPTPIHTWVASQPGEGYGWAVSELADIDGDHVTDAVVGGPLFASAAGANAGHVDVRSGRSGDSLASYVGAPREFLGYAIADAGDVDNDGVHDIILGAPQGWLSCTGSETGPGIVGLRRTSMDDHTPRRF